MLENFPTKEESDTLGAGHVNKLGNVARCVSASTRGAYQFGRDCSVIGLQPFVQRVVEVTNAQTCGDDDDLVEIRPKYFRPSSGEWLINEDDGPYCLDYKATEIDKSDVAFGDIFIAYFDPQRGHFVGIFHIKGTSSGDGDSGTGCECVCAEGAVLNDGVVCCKSHLVWVVSLPPFGTVTLLYSSDELWESEDVVIFCGGGNSSTYKVSLQINAEDDVLLSVTTTSDDGCGEHILQYVSCCTWRCLCINEMERKLFNLTGLATSEFVPCKICVVPSALTEPGGTTTDPIGGVPCFADPRNMTTVSPTEWMPSAWRVNLQGYDGGLCNIDVGICWEIFKDTIPDSLAGDTAFRWVDINNPNAVLERVAIGCAIPEDPTLSPVPPIVMTWAVVKYILGQFVAFTNPQEGCLGIELRCGDFAGNDSIGIVVRVPALSVNNSPACIMSESGVGWRTFVKVINVEGMTADEIVCLIMAVHTLTIVNNDADPFNCVSSDATLPGSIQAWPINGGTFACPPPDPDDSDEDPTRPSESGDCDAVGDDYGGNGDSCNGTASFQWTDDDSISGCQLLGHVGNPCWINVPPSACSSDPTCISPETCNSEYTLEELDSILGVGDFLGQIKILTCRCSIIPI